MTSTNASAVGTYLNIQLDDTSEVDFQWNSNGSSVTAIYYEKGDALNSTATVFFNSTFPVTSPHSNFHGIYNHIKSNVKRIHLTGPRTQSPGL